jgi:hypothetical protein
MRRWVDIQSTHRLFYIFIPNSGIKILIGGKVHVQQGHFDVVKSSLNDLDRESIQNSRAAAQALQDGVDEQRAEQSTQNTLLHLLSDYEIPEKV